MSNSFKPTQQAEEILAKRYYQRNENWEMLCRRIALALVDDTDSIETSANFYKILSNAEFLPNTPCIVNAGKPNGQYAACFVLGIEDNIDSIFDTVKHSAKIHKTGGGTGFNFSNLRPEGSPVKGTAGISSGPISFMKVFDAATQQMKQGGVRRGANMGMLNITHPDIVKFIKCKNVDKQISNFNISIAITDWFMEKVEQSPDDLWITTFDNKQYLIAKENDRPIMFGITDPEEYNKVSNSTARDLFYTVGEIWDLICSQAWHNGEPGIIFIDEIHRKNSDDIEATNPCGEQPLRAGEACVLGSIDLSKHFDREYKCVDQIKLQQTVCIAVDMLNRMLDKSSFPLQFITDQVQKSRKIGLGVMGWADLLLELGIEYGDKQSRWLAVEVMKFINEAARNYSNLQGYKNETVTTIAPTGSISLLANCSSGIEPIFAWSIEHNRADFGKQTILHPFLSKHNFTLDTLPSYAKTASEISWENHILMQAAFQSYTDNAVSKTINMPNTATVDDVKAAYKLAWESKCKGLTVYRDGSRQDQVLSDATKEKKPIAVEEKAVPVVTSRPYCLDSKTYKIKLQLDSKIENTYITVSYVDSKPYEVFLHGNVREATPVVAQYVDTTTRLISLALRGGTALVEVIDQLEKVPCGHLFSIPHKIADILKEFLPQDSVPKCPECGANLVFTEGCQKCSAGCGYGKCSG